jgi:hypothetical protein
MTDKKVWLITGAGRGLALVHTWSPRLVKPSIDDGKKVRIAAIHSDFG